MPSPPVEEFLATVQIQSTRLSYLYTFDNYDSIDRRESLNLKKSFKGKNFKVPECYCFFLFNDFQKFLQYRCLSVSEASGVFLLKTPSLRQ